MTVRHLILQTQHTGYIEQIRHLIFTPQYYTNMCKVNGT